MFSLVLGWKMWIVTHRYQTFSFFFHFTSDKCANINEYNSTQGPLLAKDISIPLIKQIWNFFPLEKSPLPPKNLLKRFEN